MLFTVIICVTNFFDRVKDKRPIINTGTFVWDKVKNRIFLAVFASDFWKNDMCRFRIFSASFS